MHIAATVGTGARFCAKAKQRKALRCLRRQALLHQRRVDRVLQDAGDCHRSDAAAHRCDRACYLCSFRKCDVANEFAFTVGLHDALHAISLGLPHKHITVNLAPANLPKEGSQFNSPIVLAMIVVMAAVVPAAVSGFAVIGELALDNSITAAPGALPAAIGTDPFGECLICPDAGGSEAAWTAPEPSKC